MKTKTSIIHTIVFYDLTLWPMFWPKMTFIQYQPTFDQDKHSDQISLRSDEQKNVTSIINKKTVPTIYPCDLVFFHLQKLFLQFIPIPKFSTPDDRYAVLTHTSSKFTFWP